MIQRMPLCVCGHKWGDHARDDPDFDNGKRPCIGAFDDCRCPDYRAVDEGATDPAICGASSDDKRSGSALVTSSYDNGYASRRRIAIASGELVSPEIPTEGT
jgi:hypothetical protein